MNAIKSPFVVVLVLGLLVSSVAWSNGAARANALGVTPTFEQISDSAHKISYAELVFQSLKYEGQSVHFSGKLFRVYQYDEEEFEYEYEFVVQVYGTPDTDSSSKRFNIVHILHADEYGAEWDSLPEGTEVEFVATMLQMGEIEIADGTIVTRPLMLVEHIRLT